jgi:hypothetical protein
MNVQIQSLWKSSSTDFDFSQEWELLSKKLAGYKDPPHLCKEAATRKEKKGEVGRQRLPQAPLGK